ncbi:hypothetical protein OROHE_001290 [Orobanche hederae]
MVSDSPSNSNSSTMYQFIISDSITNQTQFTNQQHHHHHDFDPYDTTDHSTYPHSDIPLTRSSTDIVHHHHAPPRLSDESDICHERCLMDLLGTSNDASYPPQRLSLSLGSFPCRQHDQYIKPTLNSTIFSPGYLNPGLDRVMINDDYSSSFPAGTAFSPPPPPPLTSFNHHQPCSAHSYWDESFARFLKPAQSLLQEMVSVGGKEIDASNQKYVEKLSRAGRKGSYGLSSDLDLRAEFSDSELYIYLLKLLAMLEELERRYEEYYHHMEDLVSSFEMMAGLGSGNSYTGLALQAMSKHFCTLRNAIVYQIRATKQKIEKDTTKKTSSTLSQLSLFDDQDARRNRFSLQQIGLMHSSGQAWRPIRGLPETSVTILRAWLFEHFLHPYPTESEKLMLASQTGLSKNQVSNWFINARVRLWKPMIEEMYKEEFADQSSTESDQLLSSSSSREGVGDSAEDFI